MDKYYYYPHFSDEETEGLRGYQVKSGGQLCKSRLSGPRACVLGEHRTLLMSNTFKLYPIISWAYVNLHIGPPVKLRNTLSANVPVID